MPQNWYVAAVNWYKVSATVSHIFSVSSIAFNMCLDMF